MNESEKRFLRFLDELKVKYSDSITNISRTGKGNDFIESENEMISLDEIAKDYAKSRSNEELSSVDGLHYVIKDGKLILYFFEFKKMDFFSKNLLPKEKLNRIIEKIESSNLNEKCKDELKKLKKELSNRLLVQLKLKPIESLFILHNLYEENHGKHEEITSIEKHYYVVSQTPNEYGPFTKNKSKTRRKGKSKEIFDFLIKLHPFPFKQTKSINEKSFLEIISSKNN